MTAAPLPFLDEHEVRRHLTMADLVPAAARVLADLSAGGVYGLSIFGSWWIMRCAYGVPANMM